MEHLLNKCIISFTLSKEPSTQPWFLENPSPIKYISLTGFLAKDNHSSLFLYILLRGLKYVVPLFQ